MLSGQALPALFAKLGARLAHGDRGPWRLGKRIIVPGHAQVREALARDLEFGIAPINGKRIAEVDEAFVLGMDRGAVLVHEREALYRALAAVDRAALLNAIADEIAARLSKVPESPAITT